MKTTICIWAALLAAKTAYSATVDLDSYWDGQPSTLRQSLINACNAAGNGGRINLSNRVYSSDKDLAVTSSVRIVGTGRWGSRIVRTDTGWGPVLNIWAPNVELNSMNIDGNIVSAQNNIADRFGVITQGNLNTKIINCTVWQVDYGVHNGGGKPIDGLLVDNAHFVANHIYGLWLWSSNDLPSPSEAGRMLFKNSYVSSNTAMGLNVDYGAEGLYTPSNTTNVSLTKNGQRSEISDNYIGTSREFCIAIARSSGINLLRNTAEGGTGTGVYTQALHIEDRTTNIDVTGGTLMNYHNVTANGNNFNSIIAITSLYAEPWNRRVRGVSLNDITLKGTTNWGIEVIRCEFVHINNLNFSEVNSNGPKINSWEKGHNLKVTGNTALSRSDVSQGPDGFYSLPGGGWLNSGSNFQ